MADRQFVLGGVESAPADWVLPAALDIIPKTAYASFDGSGAATSYVPLLRIISDSGHIAGEFPCGTAVAAGASADVTWFPSGSGGGGGTIGTPGTILQTWFSHTPANNFTFNSTTPIASTFPANGTFTKLSNTSVLLITFNCDATPGGAPDTIGFFMKLDGVIETACNINVSENAGCTGVSARSLAGITAGAHSVNINVSTFHGNNCTLLCKDSCDMEIIEFESTVTS